MIWGWNVENIFVLCHFYDNWKWKMICVSFSYLMEAYDDIPLEMTKWDYRGLHKNVHHSLRWTGFLLDTADVLKSLHQSSCLSPTVFNTHIERQSEYSKEGMCRYTFNLGNVKTNTLQFISDKVLAVQSIEMCRICSMKASKRVK